MTIQDLGSIGEFVASIGVIVSLVYLAVQIRQNSKQLGDSAKQATQTSIQNQNCCCFKTSKPTSLSGEACSTVAI